MLNQVYKMLLIDHLDTFLTEFENHVSWTLQHFLL